MCRLGRTDWIYFVMFRTRMTTRTDLLQLSCILLCVILPFSADCAPSLTPSNGNPVYVADGAGSYDLSWNYNTGGGTIKEVELLYRQGSDDIYVAQMIESPNPSALTINQASGYSGRIAFFIGSGSGSGRVTFRISNIVQSDSRTFKCQLSFTSFHYVLVQSSTDLVVVVPPTITLKSQLPVTIDQGNARTLLCVASGNPTPSITWTKGNKVVQQTSNTNYTIASATKDDAGRYTCTARVTAPGVSLSPDSYSILVTVRYKPTITGFPQSVYTVNETNNVTMVCRADGIPEPSISWTKTSSDKNVGYGEQIHIINTRSSDDGAYTCAASNELGSDSKGLALHVQTPPTILTSTPITMNIPGATGEEVELTCIVSGKPTPALSWKRDPKGNELSSQNDPKVRSITSQAKTIKMKVIVTKAGKEDGDKYYCFAVNLLGNDTQGYIIRERGAPDPPVDLKLVPFQVPDSQTVSVNVSWTPGYSGGFDQEFSIHYRKKGSGGDFTEESIGHPANNMHTVQKLRPNTEYEFMMQASNQRGKSEASVEAQVKTPDSAVPPDRGTVKSTRMSDDLTVIVVTWTVTDEQVTKLSLEMREGDDGWSSVPGATDMSTSTTEFKVENLKADKKYRFRLDMRRPGENSPSYVESNIDAAVPPGKGTDAVVPPDRGTDQLSAAELSGIVIAIVILLVIVASSVYIFWFKRQGKKGDRINKAPEEIRRTHFHNVVEIEDEIRNENFTVVTAGSTQ